jgi:outer membrane beta-barrel protein
MRFIIVIASLLLASAAVAAESDKLDIKKLEQKYWSAKDDDYSVVQNRAFTKEKRYFFYGNVGIPINDPYSTGQVYSGSLGYYFTEKWGAEVTYANASLTDNDATEAFIKQHQTVPDHNRLKDLTTASVMFVPLYAKMSFLDHNIIYFDMGVSAGLGQTTYEIVNDKGNKIETAPHTSLNVFQHFFFSEHFAMRFDFKNFWTQEDKERYRVQGVNRDPKLPGSTVNDTLLMVGATFWY